MKIDKLRERFNSIFPSKDDDEFKKDVVGIVGDIILFLEHIDFAVFQKNQPLKSIPNKVKDWGELEKLVEQIKNVDLQDAKQSPAKITTDPNDERLKNQSAEGQNEVYLVLSDEELAKGFVRPFRDKYVHKGIRPKHPLRDLTEEEKERYKQFNYVKYEVYPESYSSVSGRFWTQLDLNSGCGVETVMGQKLSETYARDPKFYGATFCVGCNKHLPVAEFVWSKDGEVVGS